MEKDDRRGVIWAAIRDQLPKLREELQRALESGYEMESAWFDGIARKLADAVLSDLKKKVVSTREL